MAEQAVIILRGLPAAGKTTWAKAWRDVDPRRRVIVNRDQIRLELFGRYRLLDDQQEGAVTDLEVGLAERALRDGKSVVVDDTNLEPQHLAVWTSLADGHRVPYRIHTIETPLAECLRRNRRRAAAGGRFVPEDVIENMSQIAEMPTDEGELAAAESAVFCRGRRGLSGHDRTTGAGADLEDPAAVHRGMEST
ncbi:AAA family ATPase [Mycobacterium hubeiense]|uniref:AAA family ATPase n=1 Tax=Mycobacterium hubeiense TaxID=1867256 RepID=UPI0013041DCE|nr:AAA family ATPase [Mycobacterium sp. QGD 101]